MLKIFNDNALLSKTGIHATFKLGLRGMLLPLQRVVTYFRETLIRRKLNVDRKNSTTTVKSLLESTVRLGFANFTKNLTASLTEEGIKLCLDQFQGGFAYKIEKVLTFVDIDKALKPIEKKRGASAVRFRCLISNGIENADKFATGDYYKVTSRTIGGSIDLVFVSPCGSLACTSSSYARWGMPSKHIFAIFHDGAICFNMKQHFHPVYHLQFMNDIAVTAVSDYTVASDVPNGLMMSTDSTACWNWAQKSTEESWRLVGLGGEMYHDVAYPTVKSISQASESIAEKTKKSVNFIVPYINNSREERDIFYLYYEGLLQR